MKTRFLAIFLLILAPCMLRAQSGAALRAGDTIELRISGIPQDLNDYNGTYTVDDEGMINLPLINKVKIAGLLPNEIQSTIQKRLVDEKYFIHPVVSVQQNAAARYVNVSGHVRSPNRIAYTADMTLSTAITAASGFDDYADKKKVELLRDGKVTRYNTEDIRRGRTEDPKVLPGDKINVPASFL